MQQGVVEVAGELIGPILDMEGPADGDTSSAVGADKLPVDDMSVMDAGASSVGERGESERGRRGKLGRDDELDAAEPGTRAEQTTRMEAGWRLPPLLGHPGFQHASWLDVESNSESNSASQSKSNDLDAGEERGPVAGAKTVNPSLLWVGRELGGVGWGSGSGGDRVTMEILYPREGAAYVHGWLPVSYRLNGPGVIGGGHERGSGGRVRQQGWGMGGNGGLPDKFRVGVYVDGVALDVVGHDSKVETPFRTPFRTFSVWLQPGTRVLMLEVASSG